MGKTKVNSNNLLEPQTYKEARKSPKWSDWKSAMEAEIDSTVENRTFELVPRPPHRNVLTGKWVFRLKTGGSGEILRFKARYCVRGFSQEAGIDYHETFATVVKPMSYKILFAIAAAFNLEIEQMDVKTAFLYGEIDEEVYVEQPEGMTDGTDRVWKLRKALYGLKQAPRIWYETIKQALQSIGFEPLIADYGIFARGGVFIAIYVDDLLIVGPDMSEINTIKAFLASKFKMTDIGPCNYYLGISIQRDRMKRRISLNQRAYLEKILREFGMSDCKPVNTPVLPTGLEPAPTDYKAPEDTRHQYARMVGSLMYAMLGTRPDITYAVSLCSRFMANPTIAHFTAAKRVLRYLKGTLDLNLVYEGALEPLFGYTDSDWAGDRETRRSTAGYIFSVGNAVISWQSKRQATVALSSCEAEYMGYTQATKEAIWLRNLLASLLSQLTDAPKLGRTVIYGDNQGAIAMTKNPEFHSRTKHIDTQHHYVRERVAAKEVALEYVPTEKQVADGLTKALPGPAFQRFVDALGLR